MMRFVLLNPNTSGAATAMMVGIARAALGDAATIEGMTAHAGAPLITDPAALMAAATEVAAMAETIAEQAVSGVLVAAFGDPGLDAARARLSVPVTGLAEAAIRAAAAGGRRFSIVTTTPALDEAIRSRVASSGMGANFAGIRYTRSGPGGMVDPDRLHDELSEACERAVSQDRADAIIIGGGPLAAAARRLRQTVSALLIEPIPVAAQLMLSRAIDV